MSISHVHGAMRFMLVRVTRYLYVKNRAAPRVARAESNGLVLVFQWLASLPT
jgi:hypothetical protein